MALGADVMNTLRMVMNQGSARNIPEA